MCDRRIHANNQIQVTDRRGRITEVIELGREVDNVHSGWRPCNLRCRRAFLQREERDGIDSTKRCERRQRDGTGFIPLVTGATAPNQADP